MIGLRSLKEHRCMKAETHRENADEEGGGDWSDASGVAGCHKKLGERHGIDSPSEPSSPVDTSSLDCNPLELGKNKFLLFQAT